MAALRHLVFGTTARRGRTRISVTRPGNIDIKGFVGSGYVIGIELATAALSLSDSFCLCLSHLNLTSFRVSSVRCCISDARISKDMVLDEIDYTNNTPAAAHILGWRQLDNSFDPIGCRLGSGSRKYEAQKFHLYCHTVALVEVNLHPHRG